MALKKIYGGSQGPYPYDDTDLINDRDDDFTGITQHTIVTDGQLWIGSVPTEDEHVVRKIDLVGVGLGDVIGPAGAVDSNLAEFDHTTGKLIKDGGISHASVLFGTGTHTGDIVRWNATSSTWEVKEEPFSFAGIVLTPALVSLVEAEGAVYYSSAGKSVMVCTDI